MEECSAENHCLWARSTPYNKITIVIAILVCAMLQMQSTAWMQYLTGCDISIVSYDSLHISNKFG